MNSRRPKSNPVAAQGVIEKTLPGFTLKNISRFFRNDFFIAIMIEISTGKTLIDFAGKTAERFLQKNRDPFGKS